MLTPEISRALAEIASGLELAPQLREEIIKRVPDSATTEADLPEDLRFLLDQLRAERDRDTGDTEDVGEDIGVGVNDNYARRTRTLTLAGQRVTFSTAVLDRPITRVEACGPDMPHLDPDDDGAELMAAALPSHWRGQLVPYNIAAPDGRIIKAPTGDPKTRDMPLPLSAQVASADGHDNAVLVGRVNRVWTQDGSLWGEGEFDLATPEGRDWAGRVARGMAGWGSVDLDAGSAPRIESQGRNKVPKRTFGDWTFAGYTLVSRPAFDSSRITAHFDNAELIDNENNAAMPPHVERELDGVNDMFPGEPVAASNGNCGCGGALEADDAALTFPPNGEKYLPIGDPTDWDGAQAENRMRAWAGVDAADPTPAAWNKYGQGFFYRADNPSKFADFKLPFADVIDGRLTAMPRGVFAAAAAVQGSRGNKPSIPADAMATVKGRISGYYRKMNRKAPWDDDSMTASLDSTVSEMVYTSDGITGIVTGFDAQSGWLRIACGRDADLIVAADDLDSACLTASAVAGPAAPPDAWFDNPNLNGPTALTIDDDGRVYGHLATWGTCHLSFSDTCVTAPRSNTGYGYFHTGETVTASGKRLPVGKIVIGSGHAGPYAGWRSATAHYDKSSSTVAVARTGEDAYGIWIAGALVPEAKPTQVAALRRSPISGDWRRIGGNLELVAALAVSIPGFPIPRARAGIAYGQQASLVAAGSVDRQAIAQQATMLSLVETAVENVLEGYATRRQRAAEALAKIEQASISACCECGEVHDDDEDDEG